MACSVRDFHNLTYYHNYRETSDVPVAGSHGFWRISVSWKSWQMVTYCNQPKACSYVFSGRMLTRHIWQLMSNNAKHSRWKFLLQLSAVIVSIKLYVYKTSVLFCFYSINAQCRSFIFFCISIQMYYEEFQVLTIKVCFYFMTATVSWWWAVWLAQWSTLWPFTTVAWVWSPTLTYEM